MTIFSTAFLIAGAERAAKTFAQVLLSYFVIGTTGLLGFDWITALSVAGAATLASVLTSIVSAGVNGDGPSLANETVTSAKHSL